MRRTNRRKLHVQQQQQQQHQSKQNKNNIQIQIQHTVKCKALNEKKSYQSNVNNRFAKNPF